MLKSLSLALLLFSAPILAQQAAEPAAGNSADAQRLLETLKDDSKRQALIADLEALIAVQNARDVQQQSAGAQLLETLSGKVEAVGNELATLTGKIADFPALLSSTWSYFTDTDTRDTWLLGSLQLVLILFAGWLAQVVTQRLLRRFQRTIESRGGDGFWLTLVLAVLRAFLGLVAVAAFAASAYAAMTVLAPAHGSKVLALALINASVLARVTLILTRMLLAPDVAMMRLLTMSDESANYILIWVRRLVVVIAYGYFLSEALSVLGAATAVHASVAKLLGLTVVLMLVVLIMQNRLPIAARIRGRTTSLLGQLRRRAADIWHLVAILYVLAIYGVWVLEVPGGFDYVFRASGLSVAAIALAVALVTLLRRGLGKLFSLSDEQKARFPGLEARASRYLPLLLSALKFVVYAAATLTVMRIWGLDTLGWMATPLGSSVIKGGVKIALVLLISLAVWEVTSAAIERYLAAPDGDGNAIARGQRAMTLLPLLRNIVMVVLAILVILTALSELGINIGPLIAGAGILGLAIGFGAQTFVKDVITGLFILIENAVAVGDIVILGGYAGKVEAISIRSIQLRDLKGNVHRIPFSEVTSTTNRSKIYSFACFDIGVAYREDIDHCMDVIREIGAEFRNDENFSTIILEDIEVLGVQSFDDSAVIIRARIKVEPGKQLGVERAFNRLLKNRFDAEGIEIPFPHRTIYFGADKTGAAPPARVLLGEDAPPPPRANAPLVTAKEAERAEIAEGTEPKGRE